MKAKNRLIYIVVGFLLLELSIYPFKLPLLGTIALVPFFLLLEKREKPFLWPYLIGLLFFGVNLYFIVLVQIKGYEKLALWLGFVLLTAYESLFYGIWGWLYNKFQDTPYALLVAPSLWILVEFARSVTDIGFPWLNLWMTTIGDITMAGLASIIGPYGISWLLVFSSCLVYRFIKTRRWSYFAGYLLLLIAMHAGGKLSVERQLPQANKTVRVAVLQPNVLPNTVYNPEEWGETVDSLNALLDSIRDDSVDIIILSESAFPGFYRLSERVKSYVQDIVKSHRAYMLFGTAEFNPIHRKIYNSAFLVAPDGRIAGLYSKNHLVPFGEHLPFEDKIKFLQRINLGQSNYSPGGSFNPLRFDDVRMGVMICFESMFPEISRKEVRLGANLLVVMTNDGWFGRTTGPVLHYEHARFRAIETGRYIVRSAKTGISALIAPDGSIVEELPLFKAGYFIADVPLYSHRTIYTKIGDVVVLLSLLSVAVCWLILRLTRRSG